MNDTCAKELVEEHFSLLYFEFLLQNKIIDEDIIFDAFQHFYVGTWKMKY